MNIDQIRRLAHALGISSAEEMSVCELIQLLQFEEGKLPCFSAAWSKPCTVDTCPFSTVCSSYLRLRNKTKH